MAREIKLKLIYVGIKEEEEISHRLYRKSLEKEQNLRQRSIKYQLHKAPLLPWKDMDIFHRLLGLYHENFKQVWLSFLSIYHGN